MTATTDDHGGHRIDPDAETALVSHDWDASESLSRTIVSTVAALSGRNPAEMERLYDRIDPDGLEALFEPTNAGTNRNAGTVSFRLEGYTVTVHGSGSIVVTKAP
ncbi:HalOD1 output domain-containing protein [Natrialba swarupiae]|uniref:Halobacterial output domain-containing protein n=1 Tax=Natrialba swarupiae TaxID=2448032 RepID=A0A5D5AWC6_9EURY|nr:HalOD1 output domain-containing protein [Natrialba swarupiae]MCW8173201.1 hypothetical protein [Natrialba swarupiae]TYT63930.1 hypothetical protein FYC77_01605 [Natrialba swarupiae]